MSEEIELFRITAVIGRRYSWALATRKVFSNDNWQYFTTNPLVYLGTFVRAGVEGPTTDRRYVQYYDLDGVEQRLEYDKEGNTFVVEVVE